MITNLAAATHGFSSNVYLVESERVVVVDPGNGFDVVSEIEARVDRLDAVVLTHTHPDHVGNLESVSDAFDAETWGFDPEYPGVNHALADGDTLRIGDHEYTALHTPGHKDDHLCFYARDSGVLFAGDLVFENGGFGRTDLPEGNRDRLVESIEYVLETVEDLDVFYAGHGGPVTNEPVATIETARRMAGTF